MGTRFTLLRPGIVAYQDAWSLQQRIAADVRGGAAEAFILLEHPPTYTLGARGDTGNLLLSEAAFASRGATVVRSDRGGDVTFHGPGQIVGYPILNLRARGQGPVWYVRQIETLLVDTLERFGIVAQRTQGRPGVWCDEAKIAAIGVKVAGGVTTHGFALNVNTDLTWFAHIVPCGLADAGVTSMREISGREFALNDVEDAIAEEFAERFGVTIDLQDEHR